MFFSDAKFLIILLSSVITVDRVNQFNPVSDAW